MEKRLRMILIFIVSFPLFLILIYLLPTSKQTHYYEMFVTHNNIPIETDMMLNCRLQLFNKSSVCPQFYGEAYIQSSDYRFSSDSEVEDKPLRDYEEERYAFSLHVSPYPLDINANWLIEMVAKDVYNATLNYEELPKLSQDFSITFDIPLFNKSDSSHWNKITGNSVRIHAELLDDWKSKGDFYCVLRRSYMDADSNLSDCLKQLVILHRNQQCAQRELFMCNAPNRVVYTVKATRDGRNIDCIFSSKDLTSGKNYNVRIYNYVQINSGLYWYYKSSNEFGNISVP